MAMGKDRAILGPIRTLFSVGATGELTDGQLLERFATNRGEAAELAFAVLVERHGPMVLRVCRGVLADPDDREDAFQATFLVLVKKARALWVRDSLGPWLHQVAYRTASCARSTAARRRRHERLAALSRQESRPGAGDELGRILHEEIDRLPERFRAPVVLCDLEGCSHEQAARHLGCPIGSVKSRQARGRERLRDRLRRRGLAPRGGLLGTALAPDARDVLLPPALVDSTTRAVVRFVTFQTVIRGSAVSLAQGVLRSMSMTQWLKVASVLVVLGATASGIGLLAQNQKSGPEPESPRKLQAARAADIPVHEVKPEKLKLAIVERGSVESAKNQDAYCMVEGQTTILEILPEGTHVKKGQIVCALDASALKDRLLNQKIVGEGARATVRNATLEREVAEIALREYVDGIYAQEQDTLRDEISAAESAIQKAEGRLERTRHARKQLNDAWPVTKGARPSADIVSEIDIEDRIEAALLTIEREKTALKQAKRKREVLEKYTLGKTTKKLQAEVERKRLDELAMQSASELEKSKESKLEKQIASCEIRAPSDGLLVYANDPYRVFGRNQPQIEEGATVRERQKIFSLPDLTQMQVNAKVPEAMVDRVTRGLRAQITIDAFPGVVLTGVVVDVAALPDSPTPFNQDRKVYSTKVRLANGPPGLRPGMNAQVEIVVADLDNVLTVPLQAVVQFDEKVQVAVKKPDSGFTWREVILGTSSNNLVEVKKGIEPGEFVAVDPRSLLTDEQQQQIAAPKQRDARSNASRKTTGKGGGLRDRVNTNDDRDNSPRP
jgi:HlyD family secretion protein